MSDLISRQKLIEHLRRTIEASSNDGDYNEGFNDGMDFAASFASILPSAQSEERTNERTETHACDCIERQAAINEFNTWIPMNRQEEETQRAIIDTLKLIPSAQPDLSEYSDKLWRNAYERGRREAQHIIRCKDCKHYQFADNRAFGMPVKMCKWFEFEDVDDDDFCSRAERREE